MKTIEDVVTSKYLSDLNLPEHKRINPSYYIDWAYFAVREVERWIPIEEELPEINEEIIAKCERGNGNIEKYIIKRVIKKDNIKGWSWSNNNVNTYFTLKVIQWRPLERR